MALAVDIGQLIMVCMLINLRPSGLLPALCSYNRGRCVAIARDAVYGIYQTFSVRIIKNGWFELIQIEKIIITSVNRPCSNKYSV